MEQKARPEWSARGGIKLPTTEACWMTLYDATSARHYHWEVEFVKLTNRLKGIISNARYVLLMKEEILQWTLVIVNA